jgi:ketosteroid isomerase-like protein
LNTSESKYEFLKNKTCPYCQSKIKTGADFIVCSHCGTPHHQECWDENGGCTTYGCRNNPATENKVNFVNEAEDIGNMSLDSVRASLRQNAEVKTIECSNCKSQIDESSVFCRHCGYNLKEGKLPGETNEAKNEFDSEFKKRYKNKIGLTRNRLFLTIGSFIIIAAALSFLTYLSITRLNEYFSSDEYLIRNTIDNWENAWEEKDINKYKSYMSDDYEYYGKDGKKIDLKERLKRIEWTFKNYKNIKIKFTDYKMIADSSVSDTDRKIQFNQSYESDKFSEKGLKTLRMYKGPETGGVWKIYREFFD